MNRKPKAPNLTAATKCRCCLFCKSALLGDLQVGKCAKYRGEIWAQMVCDSFEDEERV